jgi:hypothetical protein
VLLPEVLTADEVAAIIGQCSPKATTRGFHPSATDALARWIGDSQATARMRIIILFRKLRVYMGNSISGRLRQ